jgi:hypothetical protein
VLGIAWSPPALQRRNRFGFEHPETTQLSISHHIRDATIEGVAYSAPFGLIGKLVDVRERTFIVSDKRSLRAPPA